MILQFITFRLTTSFSDAVLVRCAHTDLNVNMYLCLLPGLPMLGCLCVLGSKTGCCCGADTTLACFDGMRGRDRNTSDGPSSAQLAAQTELQPALPTRLPWTDSHTEHSYHWCAASPSSQFQVGTNAMFRPHRLPAWVHTQGSEVPPYPRPEGSPSELLRREHHTRRVRIDVHSHHGCPHRRGLPGVECVLPDWWCSKFCVLVAPYSWP